MAWLLALGLASPGYPSFEPGGLIDATPRSAALGGADIALPGAPDAAAGPAAHLPMLSAPALAAGWGVATEGGLTGFQVSAGGTWQGLGLGGVLRRRAAAGAAERVIGIGVGVPVEEVPGLAFGASVRSLSAEMGAEAASGLAADLSIASRLGSPADGWMLHGAASLESAFGSLDWDSGLEEDLARQARLGLAGRWRDMISGYAELRLVRGPIHREGIWALGVEYTVAVVPHPLVGEFELAPRAGFRSGSERPATATAGLGVARGPARVEYAMAGSTPGQGSLHQVSAAYRIEAFASGPGPSAGPARAVTGGDAGSAVPETATARFDTAYRTIQIAVTPPRGFVVETWAVLVLDRQGGVVWSAEGNGPPPSAVEWNGTGLDGVSAPAGEYELRLATRGPGAFRSFSTGARFRLVRPPVRDLPVPDGPGGF